MRFNLIYSTINKFDVVPPARWTGLLSKFWLKSTFSLADNIHTSEQQAKSCGKGIGIMKVWGCRDRCACRQSLWSYRISFVMQTGLLMFLIIGKHTSPVKKKKDIEWFTCGSFRKKGWDGRGGLAGHQHFLSLIFDN